MSDTPRVNIVLGKSVGPLAAAGSQEEFTAALKATMQSLIDEAKAMERELTETRDCLREAIGEAGPYYDDPRCPERGKEMIARWRKVAGLDTANAGGEGRESRAGSNV